MTDLLLVFGGMATGLAIGYVELGVYFSGAFRR